MTRLSCNNANTQSRISLETMTSTHTHATPPFNSSARRPRGRRKDL